MNLFIDCAYAQELEMNAKNPLVERVEKRAAELLSDGYKWARVGRVYSTPVGWMADYVYVKEGRESIVHDVPRHNGGEKLYWTREAEEMLRRLERNGDRAGADHRGKTSRVRLGKTAKKHAKEAEARRAAAAAEAAAEAKMTPEQRERARQEREARLAAAKAAMEAHKEKKRR